VVHVQSTGTVLHISEINELAGTEAVTTRLLAIPSRDQLVRMLRYMLDESEFLSPYGIRSVSRYHKDHPYTLKWIAKTCGSITTGRQHDGAFRRQFQLARAHLDAD